MVRFPKAFLGLIKYCWETLCIGRNGRSYWNDIGYSIFTDEERTGVAVYKFSVFT